VTSADHLSPPAGAARSEGSELHERLLGEPIMRLVGLAGQAVGNRFRRATAEEDGLSPGAGAVLLTLAFGRGRTIETGAPGRATHTELAQRCMITPATLTGIVSTLEKAGYVRRDRDHADRRVVWLVLTEEGAVRARQIGARITDANAELMKALTPELEAAMRGFLITVIENDLAVVQEAPALSEHRTPSAAPVPGRPQC
jgi:DNA-binding MarR family transcriptional regulator